jgi:two-component system nitrogen regulation response regulator NtrX
MSDGRRKGAILVIDDEQSVRDTLGNILEDEGYEVLLAASGEEGIDLAVESEPDVVFLDIWLPGIDGIEALRVLGERGVTAPVVMISGHGTIETAVRATKLGAYDFIEKPVSLERVLLVTTNALRHSRLERRNRALRAELRREAEFIGRSAAIERLRAQLAGATDGQPVLLHGEKGTGRRLAARWIALHSPHADGPFLDVQASALPKDRLVRTLFGESTHRVQEPGRLQLADEGTLYIENADTLPPIVQSSLVGGNRDGVYRIPGRRRLVRSECQLVVALLEPPERLAEAGALGEEFLSIFAHTIEIPPLKERIEDLPELCERFLDELCREYARDPLRLTPPALEAMLAYHWPGNVRELKRVLERMVLLAPHGEIGVEDLPLHVTGRGSGERDATETLRQFERRWLQQHVDEAQGDLSRAALRLGLSEDELRERLRRFGLEQGG